MKKLIVGVVLGWMACVGTANAALILTNGAGEVIGIQGLEVSGILYDVDFVYTKADATPLPDSDTAEVAVFAIVDLLNALDPLPTLINPEGSNPGGGPDTWFWFAALPSPGSDQYWYGSYSPGGGFGGGPAGWSAILTTVTQDPGSYARFTLASVPLPPAVALLAVGLLGLVVSRRKTTA